VPALSLFHALMVRQVIRETADAMSFVLEVPPELREAFHYQAGQFVTISAPVSTLPIYRCYSMSSAPGVDDELRITVKRTKSAPSVLELTSDPK
jgi:3-ketosteroid 9alpha-monooxygenase subunit B